jgi:hypothetical protein
MFNASTDAPDSAAFYESANSTHISRAAPSIEQRTEHQRVKVLQQGTSFVFFKQGWDVNNGKFIGTGSHYDPSSFADEVEESPEEPANSVVRLNNENRARLIGMRSSSEEAVKENEARILLLTKRLRETDPAITRHDVDKLEEIVGLVEAISSESAAIHKKYALD